MPRGDGTGPGGLGPRTGLGAGCCTEEKGPDLVNPVLDRGPGWHGRGGHGRRNRFRATGLTGCQSLASAVSKERHLELLNEQRKRLEGEIEEVNKKIGILEADTTHS